MGSSTKKKPIIPNNPTVIQSSRKISLPRTLLSAWFYPPHYFPATLICCITLYMMREVIIITSDYFKFPTHGETVVNCAQDQLHFFPLFFLFTFFIPMTTILSDQPSPSILPSFLLKITHFP